LGLPWVCLGSALGLPWVCLGSALGLPWVCLGSALGLPWVCLGSVVSRFLTNLHSRPAKWSPYGRLEPVLSVENGGVVDGQRQSDTDIDVSQSHRVLSRDYQRLFKSPLYH
jgi:hypothetical protein